MRKRTSIYLDLAAAKMPIMIFVPIKVELGGVATCVTPT